MTDGERLIEASDGTSLWMTDEGDGPVVILLRGLACTSSMWEQSGLDFFPII